MAEQANAAAEAPADFDLIALDTATPSDSGREMVIMHPTTRAMVMSGGKAVSIRLAGKDGRLYQDAERAMLDARAARPAGSVIKAEDIQNDGMELLVRCTLHWSDNIVWNGAPLPFSPENARMIYTRCPWLNEQAQAFVANRANFLLRS